jgi:hypothetical protein
MNIPLSVVKISAHLVKKYGGNILFFVCSVIYRTPYISYVSFAKEMLRMRSDYVQEERQGLNPD